jgi:hypothetical protein
VTRVAESSAPSARQRRPLSSPGELATAWGEWIAAQGPWHVFGALTYDQRRERVTSAPHGTPVAADVARAHVRRWLRQGDKALGGRLEAAVVALEYQKNGWPHFHPLLRLAGGQLGREYATLGPLWFDQHGYARLEEPRTQLDVAAYAAKYLVKDLGRGDVLFWPPSGSWRPHQPAMR